MIALVVASASLAEAVIPTSVPIAAFSATLLAAALVSLIAPTSNSSTSVRLIVKPCVLKLPSAEVARTMMPWLAAASRSSAPATVTTPLPALIANRPPALSSRV